uniref:Uncharacterized protein n=1 Tax=Rhizophora mucronata TaxID=61149 RepID=A0A2P2LS35_RHIMU
MIVGDGNVTCVAMWAFYNLMCVGEDNVTYYSEKGFLVVVQVVELV